MRLAPFIVAHTDAILTAWDTFASSLVPGKSLDSLALRDHAPDILQATVRDMESADSEESRHSRSGGYADGSVESVRLNGASAEHAIGRLGSGFDLLQLVSEYRALRVSVLSLWRKSHPEPHPDDVDDLSLFHESIDQSLAKAVACYTQRVDESRDMFLAILGHDLRNPLSAISMSAHLLPQIAHPGPETTEFASKITRSVKVMSRMIADLLDYTRTRLGAGMPVTRGAMDLEKICQEVLDEFSTATPALLLKLVATGELTGQWDSDRIRQVVSNLVGNAIQHGDATKPIVVTLRGEPTTVMLSVANQGKAIPPGELQQVFDPLIRGSSVHLNHGNRPGSIGLGLYIARALVTAHGGTITVVSTADTGTVFTIHLPYFPPRLLPETHPGASLEKT